MPREQITRNRIVDRPTGTMVESDTPNGITVAPGIVHVEEARRNVHVQWNRTGGSGAFGVQHDIGWVQLGIDVTVADLRSLLVAAETEAAAEARRLADMGEIDTEQYQFRITSDVISRRETNLAIATLRRARDVAYGKDA